MTECIGRLHMDIILVCSEREFRGRLHVLADQKNIHGKLWVFFCSKLFFYFQNQTRTPCESKVDPPLAFFPSVCSLYVHRCGRNKLFLYHFQTKFTKKKKKKHTHPPTYPGPLPMKGHNSLKRKRAPARKKGPFSTITGGRGSCPLPPPPPLGRALL